MFLPILWSEPSDRPFNARSKLTLVACSTPQLPMNQQDATIPAFSGYDSSKFAAVEEIVCTRCSGMG